MLFQCFILLFLVSTVHAAAETEISAEEQDRLFDESLLNTTGRPRTEPQDSDVSRLSSQCPAESSSLTSRRRRQTAGSCPCTGVDLVSTFFQASDWSIPTSCCPRSQYYDCRVQPVQLLPCFWHLAHGVWEYCCPLRPYYIYNCNCRTCIKNCGIPQCFATGTCRRRYTIQTVQAICWNPRDGWHFCHEVQIPLPTSCYCDARCSFIG